MTIRKDGREIPVVLQATKTGMLFVLDRDTEKPVFPVEERPVPASAVPGEEAWPTQPFTTFLPPLSPHLVSRDEVWGLTSGEREACRRQIESLRNEGIFTPPSLQRTLVIPSNIGGAHWGGVAFDSARGVVVPTNRIAAVIRLIPREQLNRTEADSSHAQYTDMRGTPYVLRREMLLSPRRLPCTPTLFGTLVALDLGTGLKRWEVTLGTARDFIAAKIGLPLALRWGTPNLGGPIVTAGGLIFMGGTMDHYLRAFDIETGAELWKGRLPAGAKATPMTYRLGTQGRQYVVIAAGGDGNDFGRSDEIVAFALPR